MKKYLVILFVCAMAQPLLAQKSAPSKDWADRMKEVVLASSGWEATNSVVPGGISPEMLNDEMWEDVLFGYPSHVKPVNLEGDFILLDGANEYRLIDTTLSVWVSDLSVPFYIPPSLGVDVDDPKFLVPLYEGSTSRIIKVYTPSGQMPDVLAEAKKGFSETSDDATKVANIEWVEEGKSFFHEDRFYQKNGDKWETEDPDAPKAIKAGDRKKDPTFIFSKNAEGEWEPTASNKRNGYKFGMGDYAGYSQNYYRHASNGAPLGSAGAYGYPVMLQPFYSQPMWGGGFGNNWGIGGFGGGFSVGFGFGGGFGNGFGCMPSIPYYGCMPNRWVSGGSSVWNGYSHVGIDWVGSGVGYTVSNNYYGDVYNDGCGGCKSAVTSGGNVEEEYVELASAELGGNSTSFTQSTKASAEGQTKVGLATSVTTERKVPALVLPSSIPTGSVADRKVVEGNKPTIKLPPSTPDMVAAPPSKEPMAPRGGLQAPAGANGRGTSETFAENRQGSSGVSTKPAAKPQTAPQGRVNGGSTAQTTKPSGYGTKPSVNPPKQPRANGNRGQVYGNTTPSRNGGTVSRNTGGVRPSASPSRTHHQVRTVSGNTRVATKPVAVRPSQPARQQMRTNSAPARNAMQSGGSSSGPKRR